MKNILIIDAGNTRIKFAYVVNDQITKVIAINKEDVDDVKLDTNIKIDQAYLCSVIPSYNKRITEVVKKQLKHDLEIFNKDHFKPYFDLKQKTWDEVGLDILAYAYYILDQKKDGLGVSYGTALFFVLIKNATVKGVIIAPSFTYSAKNLNTITELINTDQLDNDQLFFDFGIDTNEALTAGINFGILGIINQVIAFSKEKYDINNVYFTGGKIKQFAFLQQLIKKEQYLYDEYIVIKGCLALIKK